MDVSLRRSTSRTSPSFAPYAGEVEQPAAARSNVRSAADDDDEITKRSNDERVSQGKFRHRACSPARARAIHRASRIVIATMAFVVFVAAFATTERASATCARAPTHVVFVDAGSTGCRAHAFAIEDARSIEGLFALKTLGTKVKTKTALADMKGKVALELAPAIRQAQGNIADERARKNAQVYVWATAGFRVLAMEKQRELWDEVRDVVKRETTLGFGRGHFKTIDGADEGFYAWLAANYLSKVDVTSVGKLREDAILRNQPFERVADGETPLSKSVGAIDVGGGSVQYVALAGVGKGAMVKSMHELRDAVKVESFLGYGASHMEARWRGALAAEGRTANACAFPGYVVTVDGVELNGTGVYSECVAGLRNQLAQMQREQRVSLRMPEQFRDVGRFLGMSLLFHVTNFMTIAVPGSLASMPKATLTEIGSAGEKLCAMEWRALVRDVDGKDPNTPTERMNGRCFDAALVQALLGSHLVNDGEYRGDHVGMGFSQVDDRIEFIEKIMGAEVEWTLGAALSVVHPTAARANPMWAKTKTPSDCASVFHTAFYVELLRWSTVILPAALVVMAYLWYRIVRGTSIVARSPSFVEIL